jgi:hypothetical protein
MSGHKRGHIRGLRALLPGTGPYLIKQAQGWLGPETRE